ncbi:unnamed protein product [Linum trigynum]|uniref:Protein kinase domain-containing protein n=1 Tax=Linum trigynum TaxID=586398 RepID=A0AAV2D9S2_9ROSI
MGLTRGDRIGKGGYGEVFIAIPSNPAFNKMAVKSAPVENAASLLIEYQILEKFRDVTGVVQTFGPERREPESGSGGGGRTYNLLMELAPRGSLVNLIGDYFRIGRRIAGIPETHIADFGLAMETWKLSPGSKRFTGTLRYMSPEVAVEGKVSPAMDIWRLGCTLVEMLTGNLSWSKFKEDREVFMEIAAGRTPEIPEWMSVQGKDFLRKCLDEDGGRAMGGGGMEMQRSAVAVRPLQLFQQGRAAALMC